MDGVNKSLLDIVTETLAFDKSVDTGNVKKSGKLTMKRGDDGILYGYDENGRNVGRIYEHGDNIDEIEEV